MRFRRSLHMRPVMTALGLTVIAGLGVPAAAQDDTAAPAAPAAAPAGEEEVVVTARRRKETVQSVPLSVTAVSPKTLENQAAPDIQDLEGLTPNLIIDPVTAGPSAAAIAIRGISFEDIEKSFDPAVGVIVDGIYIGTNTGQLLDFFDFESIEVLRGPQGTLFGRNTTGGVINIRRSTPTGAWGGKFSATFGNYGRKEYRSVLNLPEIAGVSTKVYWLRKEGDGFYNNVTRDVDEPNFSNDSFGATFRIAPSENFDLQFTVENNKQRGETVGGSLSQSTDLICVLGPLLGLPPNQCNRNTDEDLYTTFSNVAGPIEYDEMGYTLEGNVRFGGLTLTSVTGLRQSDESVRQDFDASSINFFDTLRVQDYEQFSQELRLAGDITDTIDFVAGLYYFRNEYQLDQITNLGFAGARTRVFVDHEATSSAAFIDVDWRFAEGWRLSLGGRYTKDEKSIVSTLATGVVIEADDEWSKFTPKVTLDWQANDDIMLYAGYSQGYRSGGYNGRAASFFSVTTAYEPETVDSFELGAKTAWLDDRLILNLAVFHTKYKDKQEDSVIPLDEPPFQETVVGNAASATITGFEIDMTARITSDFTITGALGWLDAEYEEFPRSVLRNPALPAGPANPFVVVDFSTLNLRRTPTLTASLGADYRIITNTGDVVLSASYQFIDGYDSTINAAFRTGGFFGPVGADGLPSFVPATNDPRGRTEAQNNLDASVTWNIDLENDSTVRLTAFGRNLLDERGLSAALPVAGLFAFGGARPPLTYGIEIGYSF